jgi:hypothetical protein
MCRKLLVLILSLTLLFGGISSSFASPSPSDSSVVLSPAEAASIRSALEKSEAALQASNKEIETQSRQITMLWISCGVMVGIDLGAVGLGLYEALRK